MSSPAALFVDERGILVVRPLRLGGCTPTKDSTANKHRESINKRANIIQQYSSTRKVISGKDIVLYGDVWKRCGQWLRLRQEISGDG